MTKKRILVAAELVFSRDGLQGATNRDIAREAGVNEVTIFRHFHTRDELLGATLEHGCAALDAVIHYEEVLKGELADSLEDFIRETYSVFKQRETIVRAFIGEAHLLPKSFRSTLQEFMMRRKGIFVAVLKQAQELGLLRRDLDVSAVADCFRDSIYGAMLRHTLYNSDPETVDAHLRGITDIFYRGIRANDGRNS